MGDASIADQYMLRMDTENIPRLQEYMYHLHLAFPVGHLGRDGENRYLGHFLDAWVQELKE